MANLDEGTVGIQILAGLPDGNGLPSIAESVLDDPKPVFALVELRPRKEVHNIDSDSHTVVLRIQQIEPLQGDEAKKLREQLDTVRERRTGQRPLIPADGQVPDGLTSDDAPAVPVDGEVPTGAAAAVGDSATVPAFTPPTPIGKKTAASKPAKP